MFYTIIEALREENGRHPVVAAVRYSPDDDKVTIVGSGRLLEYLVLMLGKNSPSVGWRSRKNVDHPISAALGNPYNFRHFEKGEGQEQFMRALSDLEGHTTKNISLSEEDDDGEE